MARDFKFIFALCLIAACLGPAQTSSTFEIADGGSDASDAVSSTTATPGGSTAPATVSPAPTTPTQEGSTAPATVSPAPTTPTEATGRPTQPSNPCVPNPCGQGSTCEPRANQSFVCLCLPGESYNHDSKSCENAKVFPGALSLPGLTYDENMKDNTSPEFLEAAKTITDELSKVFENNSDYSGSTVLKIEPISSTRVWSRAETGVKATVEISFEANADISSDQILNDIKSYANSTDGPLKGGGFKEGSLCSKKTCDSITTTCLSKDGSYSCTCKDGYVPIEFSNQVCTACPSGTKAVDSKCVACPFGYSGFNCDESWQLTVVIVGSVLGGLLLITLILLPIVACKSSKKKNAGVKKPYESHSVAGAPLVHSSSAERQSAFGNGSAFANVGVPRIPRAAPTSSWDRRNNLEMTLSNSQQNLVPGGRNANLYEDTDKVAPYGRPQPQINPYAQNRPQINPYATSQGHTNHSYLHDNGRRFN